MKEINATEAHQVSHLRLGLTFDIRWHPLKVSLMFYGSQKVRMSLLPGGSWHCLTWKCRQREGAENQSIFTSNNGFRYVQCVQLFKSIC